jgi:plasmid stabilization system protein ParE
MGQVYWTEPALDDVRDIVSLVARNSKVQGTTLVRRLESTFTERG